jgi:hypothetical protein
MDSKQCLCCPVSLFCVTGLWAEILICHRCKMVLAVDFFTAATYSEGEFKLRDRAINFPEGFASTLRGCVNNVHYIVDNGVLCSVCIV